MHAMAGSKSKAPTKRTKSQATPRVRPTRADGRPKSKLTIAGDQAKLDAERALLLETLTAESFNLTHTAAALGMSDASTVLRAIDRYGLRAEYEKHRA